MTSPSTGPIFPGVARLLDLISCLTVRPGARQRTENSAFPGDQPLPLVLLHRGAAPTEFLTALSTRLRQTPPPRVPHACVDATGATERARRRWGLDEADGPADKSTRQPPVLPILDELADHLAHETFAGNRLSRFDRYRLADWLSGQRLEPAYGRDDRAGIVQILRGWVGSQPAGDSTASAMEAMPSVWARLAVWAVTLLGRLVDLRWLRERVPRLGPERRWLMRQPYMVPRHSVDFLGFAERLTVGHREAESPEQLKKLLVHAFLEDLRRGYRRFRWRLVPRPTGWRRTAYVVVLLQNVTGSNGGRELLRLISEVRNETGELDPLLVVAETDEQPSPAAEPVTPDEVDTAIKAWRNRLPVRRQKLDEGARYLYIRLPERATAVRAAPDRDAWDIQPTFRPGQPPWLARQRVLTAVVTLAVVGAGALPAVRSWQHVRADCAVSGIPADWGPGTIQVEPRAVGGGRAQCVGYSDSGRFVFGRDNRLRETQRLVFRQNDEARRIREQNRHRPLVTLVYFSSLTHPSGRPQRGDQVVAEELEGLLLRQREYNNDASNRGPLLRVIVANGGEAMGAARGVVSDFLLPLLAEDPTIVGVVGLDRTVPETEAAISELGLRAGVPVVGTMLTGTGLTGLSPLYFQMVPGNAQQAELIDRYAATSRKNVSVYYPAGTGDSYVETLVAEFAKLGPAGCAGGDLPEIVADDTTSRFVATRDVVHLSNLARVPVSYVALGSPVVLAGPQCVQGRYAGSDDRLVGFCRGYHRLREELNSTLPEPDRVTSLWPADEIGIAYDTAELFLHAVSEVQRNAGTDYGATPHRSALALKFVETTFQGATGIVDFTRHRDGTDRNRAIVRIDDISAADSEPTCRFFIDVRDQAAGDVNRCDKLADAGTGG